MTSDTLTCASFRNTVRSGKHAPTRLDSPDLELDMYAEGAHERAPEHADDAAKHWCVEDPLVPVDTPALDHVIPYRFMKATAPDGMGGLEQAYARLFELGRGGMARVYLAESHAFGLRKLVVLKVLNPEYSADSEVRASFRREAELSAQMNHPNVVQVMAVDEYLGMPAIVMEYLDGVALSALLKDAGKDLPLRLRVYILSQVLAGLHHFHELKDLDGAPLHPVHRDVSPQNVMILHDGPVKVLDFGIAKICNTESDTTHSGTVKGKLHYMPPEQLLDGAHVDRRADIFAVGVMLWEAVADRRMWKGKTEVELLRNLAKGTLPDLREAAPDVPESILQVVMRATDLDREKRFTSALQMQVALEQASTQEGFIVQQRELAEFMAQHFGEQRQEQELRIKSALRAQREANAKVELTPRTRVLPKAAPPLESAKPTVRISDLAMARTSWRSRRGWGWVVALLGCVVLAGGWTIRSQHLALARAGEQRTPRTVAFEIEAQPAGAEIQLDGRLLGRDRYVGKQPYSDAKVVLEVSAPGHLSQKRAIALRNDLSLHIVLEPEPAREPPPVAVASPKATSSASSTDPPTPRRALPSNHTHKVAVSGARSRRCTPPYSIGADGVKTYKPECF